MKHRPRRAARPQSAAAVALLLALVACGGGGAGGSSNPKPDDPPPPGVAGRAFFADVDLGLVAEVEPNDGRAQPCRLAPLGPRTTLQVTGEVGVTAARYGRTDPLDVLLLQVVQDQEVALGLVFTPDDPESGSPNAVELEVWDAATDTRIASTSDGGQPLTAAFLAEADAAYQVVVRCDAGHAAWTLTVTCADPPGGVPATEEPSAKSLSAAPPPAAAGHATQPGACSGAHVLVRLRAGADPAAVAQRFGLVPGRRTGLGAVRMRFAQPVAPERVPAFCAGLEADEDVEGAEPDWLVTPMGDASAPDDPEYARQWNLRAVGAPGAWAITEGDPSVVVGVVDTGIVAHPDLEGQVVAGYDFISDPAIAGDGDGRDPDPTDEGARDDSTGLSRWHGTHVAAIIAARSRDGYGIAGIAPGCRVMPLRAVGRGGGLVSDVADAILYAAGLLTTEDGRSLANPLPVVNLSFALSQDTEELRSACSRAANVGVLLVGATGNTGGTVLYPAKYPGVVAVAAVDRRLMTTGYSNYGEDVDLSAPGGLKTGYTSADGWPDGILSCQLDETVYPPDPGHGFLEGTSQAAPHVAAAAALLLSVDPTLSPSELRSYLTWSALDRGQAGWDEAYGWGVLQVQEALRLLLADLGTPNVLPPRLLLQAESALLTGFQERLEIGVMNAGGGVLTFASLATDTDDGGAWLSAENVMAVGSGPTQVARVAVLVDRHALPSSPGRYTGTVFVRDPTLATIGSIRVVVLSGQLNRAGRNVSVLARRANDGMADTQGTASPARGYRYWFTSLAPAPYKLMAGSDLDGDGFFCEASDCCGWYGGPSEADAAVVQVASDSVFPGADVRLYPPP